MDVLDFGWKQIIKKNIYAVVVWVLIVFLLDFIKINNFTDLLDDEIHFPAKHVKYIMPVVFIIIGAFFSKIYLRIEADETKLILTSFQFFIIKKKEIKMNERMTYVITKEKSFLLYKRSIKIYINEEPFYTIKEKHFNEEEMDRVIAFFRVNVPENFKRTEQ